nr:MAG TPA: hypothetical protein [Caudoviricetes sp.]
MRYPDVAVRDVPWLAVPAPRGVRERRASPSVTQLTAGGVDWRGSTRQYCSCQTNREGTYQ